MSKKVLMAVSNYYTSVFQVGSHHYARAFAKLGYEVAFISFPISPFHKLVSKNTKELIEREDIYKNLGFNDGEIWYYVPQTLFAPGKKPLFSSKFIIDNWYKFTYPNLIRVLKSKGFDKVDVIWFDSSIFAFFLDEIEYKLSIMRIADYSKGFSGMWPNYYLKEVELINRVDKIVVSAENLKEKYNIKEKPNVLYAPNGLDIDFFNNADTNFPTEFKNIPEPRVIYIGCIHDWFDTELVSKAAKALPGCNFVLIGPVQRDLSILENLKNVHIIGSRPYSQIAQYLTHSQIGIIPFKVNELINSVNPIKLYEYMICGLPVVSMEWEELKNINSPAFLSKNYDEFINNIELALNSTDKDNYISFAQNHSWSKRLNLMLTN